MSKPKEQIAASSAGQTNTSSGYASVNGLRMYFEVHGNDTGIPLVLIHGGGSSIDVTFGKVLPTFADLRKVIAMDLQAHGRSGDRDADSSFFQDADDVAALLKELNVPRADVLGFSNGGNTAMQLAIRHPHLINKLVLASAFYKREGLHAEFWAFMKHADLNSMPEELKTAYLSLGHSEDELRNMHNRDARRMQQFVDWHDDDIRSIRSPTMILSADQDVVKVDHSLLMSTLIADSTLVILPGAHGEYLGEAGAESKGAYPQVTITLINTFLSR